MASWPIRVLDVRHGSPPRVAGDEFVPLMLRWGGLVPCVYVMLTDSEGGTWGEVKINRATGARCALTLLRLPEVASDAQQHRIARDVAVSSGVPVMDLAPFDPTPDNDPRLESLEVASAPALARVAGHTEVWRRGGEVARWLRAGPVQVGIDREKNLTAVRWGDGGEALLDGDGSRIHP